MCKHLQTGHRDIVNLNMETSLLNHLEPAYNSALEKQDMTACLDQLSSDAIQWWFNFDVPRIAMHFAFLQELPETDTQMPLRLVFIAELLEGKITAESIVEFYGLFQENNDPDATALAVGAGYQQILDKGSDFSELAHWQKRAEKLLQEESGASHLARSFLLGLMGFASIVGDGDSVASEVLFARQLSEIDASGSVSLKVYHVAMRSFNYFHSGDLSFAGILIQDTLPLADHAECSLICKLYLHAAHGLYCIHAGKLEMAQQILDGIVNSPLFEQMPSFLWLLIQSNRLCAYSYSGNREQTDIIASLIRSRCVPASNSIFHCYLHYSLAVVALVLQEYRKAGIHINESLLQAEKCHSGLGFMMNHLLEAQALAGLGKKEQALNILENWFQPWEDNGFTIMASTAALEAADILVSQNRIDEAREYFQRAKDYLPEGEPLQPVHRSNDFLQQLSLRLFPDDHQAQLNWAHYPIRIKTLGEFKVEIGDNVIYDQQWQGKRTKLLLKLLIIHGGDKVSKDSLIGLLWPNADGTRDKQNLKATLWRLRKLGLEQGEKPLLWLQLEGGQLSLVDSLCIVDAIIFEQQVKSLLKNSAANINELIQVLEMYQGDFLATDVSDISIIEHRERLRRLFINGVIHLSKIVDSDDMMERTLDFIFQARKLDPLHEGIHEHLMRIYLKLSLPARALQSYQHVEKILLQELGTQPCSVLVSLAESIKKECR